MLYQPPSWERYQQKMHEWNQLMSKANSAAACGGKVKKPPPAEKPAMFAFCLRPRGLEVPNKGSKHRSHKKIHANQALIGDQDGVHTFGNRVLYAYLVLFFQFWSLLSILVRWLMFPHIFFCTCRKKIKFIRISR